MSFISVFEELNRLYEVDDQDQDIKDLEAEGNAAEDTTEAGNTEPVMEEVEEEPILTEDEAQEDEATVQQVILECSNCGGLLLKSEAEVTVDEETDLANTGDACQYCEEAAGYKIVGVVAPYIVEESSDDEELEEGIFGKKLDDADLDKIVKEKTKNETIAWIKKAEQLCSNILHGVANTSGKNLDYSTTMASLEALKSEAESAANNKKKKNNNMITALGRLNANDPAVMSKINELDELASDIKMSFNHGNKQEKQAYEYLCKEVDAALEQRTLGLIDAIIKNFKRDHGITEELDVQDEELEEAGIFDFKGKREEKYKKIIKDHTNEDANILIIDAVDAAENCFSIIVHSKSSKSYTGKEDKNSAAGHLKTIINNISRNKVTVASTAFYRGFNLCMRLENQVPGLKIAFKDYQKYYKLVSGFHSTDPKVEEYLANEIDKRLVQQLKNMLSNFDESFDADLEAEELDEGIFDSKAKKEARYEEIIKKHLNKGGSLRVVSDVKKLCTDILYDARQVVHGNGDVMRGNKVDSKAASAELDALLTNIKQKTRSTNPLDAIITFGIRKTKPGNKNVKELRELRSNINSLGTAAGKDGVNARKYLEARINERIIPELERTVASMKKTIQHSPRHY